MEKEKKTSAQAILPVFKYLTKNFNGFGVMGLESIKSDDYK